MSIIQKLWWFFKLEKRRYLVGIVALVLVSVLNLIPPMVMAHVYPRDLLPTWTNHAFKTI